VILRFADKPRLGHQIGQFNHQEIVQFWRSFIQAPPLAKKTASLIEKETIEKRISNNEYRMSNIEGRNSIDFYYFKRQSAAIPSFMIRHG
jgi:hypothetical protein